MSDRIGQVLGHYRLIRLLGQGGFADVYLGEHIDLSTYAAIKVLRTQLVEGGMESFRAEARTVASLRHPNIIQVMDFGTDGLTPYFVMQYALNGTLRQHHPRGMLVPLDVVVSYVWQVAAALQYAHNQKVVHRDIKPENILIGEQSQLLLSDFGLAVVMASVRAASAGGEVGKLAGTAFYMAPEQIQGNAVPTSDQYALGAVVYEWLTGSPPFTGSFARIMWQHVHEVPAPLRARNPTLPQEVEQVVLTALNKDPQQRFPRIEDFASELGHAAHLGSSPFKNRLADSQGGSGIAAILSDPFGHRTVISQTKATIGRALDNTIVVGDTRVSAHHAELRPQGSSFSIVDAGSTNGTFVNEQQVLQNMPRMLQSGDVLRVGETKLKFELVNASQLTDSTILVPPTSIDPNAVGHSNYGSTINSGSSLSSQETIQTTWPAQPPPPPPPPPPTPAPAPVPDTPIPGVASVYGKPRLTSTGEQSMFIPAGDQGLLPAPQPGKPEEKLRPLWIIVSTLVGGILLLVGLYVLYTLFIVSTPGKTVNAFCSAIQNRNYQNAYNQLSVSYQAGHAESVFQGTFSSATSCTVGNITSPNGNVVSTITLAPAATYPWSYQLTLVKNSNGTWKINNIVAAPDLMLSTFCSDLQHQDDTDAYNLFTSSYQSAHSASQFTAEMNAVTSCSSTPVMQTNGSITSTLTLGPTATYPWTYQVTFAREGTSSWKIDNYEAAPDIVLGTFCTDILNKDYQDAYNLLTPAYQTTYSETQFKSDVTPVTGCTATSVTQSNSSVISTLTLAPATNFPWTYQVTLAKESDNSWKIDNFESAPNLVLDMFCTNIQHHDYTDAYNLLTASEQAQLSETAFTADFTAATSCTHTFVTQSGSFTTSTLTLGPTTSYPWAYLLTLAKESDNSWKIDDFIAMPYLVLSDFCTDLQHQDYTDAYALTSVGLQSNVSETQFAANYSNVISCTYSNLSDKGGMVTATITYTLKDGSTAQQIATLIKDSNGNWRIDSLLNA